MRIPLTLKSGLIIALNVATVAAASAFVLPSLKTRTALAAGTGYTATWTITKVRCIEPQSGPANVTYTADNRINIGPAEWQVTYALPGGSKISETWTASSWNDANVNADRIPDSIGAYPPKATTRNTADCTGTRVGEGSIFSNGQYGFFINTPGMGGGTLGAHGSSFPTGWKVTGTIQ